MKTLTLVLVFLTTLAVSARLEAAERKPLKPIKRTIVVDAGDGTQITWNGTGWSQK